MQTVVVSELIPTNGRKSFWGKAKILSNTRNGAQFLRSYDTTMAGCINGKVHRYSDFKSNTTNSHLKSFFDACGVDMATDEFYKLREEKAPALVI